MLLNEENDIISDAVISRRQATTSPIFRTNSVYGLSSGNSGNEVKNKLISLPVG